MLSFAIMNNSRFPEWFFLMELTFQCEMAKQAYARLAEYSHIEMSKPRHAIFCHPDEALKVIGDCTAFLSAAAVVAKLLFPRKSAKKEAVQRAAELRNKLGVTTLPHLNSTEVRNHFEHIDERLDKVITDHPDIEICQVHVSRDEPTFPVVLRRFDPTAMSIYFLGDTLDLKACFNEIEVLEGLLAEAKKTPLDRRSKQQSS